MIEIGGRPILWHIMKLYAAHGINDFVVCLGYKGYVIKEYFANYFLHTSDVTFDLASNAIEVHQQHGRAVAGDAGRHRRGDDDRRAPEARAATTSATRTSASPTATASPTSTSRALVAFHRAQRHGRDGHRGAAARPLRRARARRRAGHAASRRSRTATAAGSTAASSCSRPRSATTSTATTTGLGARAAGGPGARRRAVASTATTASGSRWTRSREQLQLEELWDSGKPPWNVVGVDAGVLAAAGASCVTGHTGFKGTWLSLWLASMGAEVTGLSDARADRAVAVRAGPRRRGRARRARSTSATSRRVARGRARRAPGGRPAPGGAAARARAPSPRRARPSRPT